MKCMVCGKESVRLFNGICSECISYNAVMAEQRALDSENELPDLEINSPLGDNFLEVFRTNQNHLYTKQGENGLNYSNLMLKMHSKKDSWKKMKPLIEKVIDKYGKELASGKYDIMPMDSYGTDGISRRLVENYKGIAIVEVLDK